MNILEQLKSVLCDPSGKCCITGSDEDRAIVERALQALAEQPAQQEPVAWCVYCDGQFNLNIYRDEDLASFRAAALEQEYPRFKREVVPLYTAPPAHRTWVGLTDDEIWAICQPLGFAQLSPEVVARAIESKLKDKNT